MESDWRTTHLVLALPVDLMMAEHWAAAVRAGAAVQWSTVWRRAQAADRLPPTVDVAAIARRLQAEQPGRVHVVVAPDTAHAAAAVGRVLRARPTDYNDPPDPSLADLVRRVNRLIAHTHDPAGVRDLAARLVEVVGSGPPGEPGSVAATGGAAGCRAWASPRRRCLGPARGPPPPPRTSVVLATLCMATRAS